MNIQTVIAIAAIIVFYLVARHRQQAQQAEQPFFDSARLQNEVNALHRCMQELEQLDEMLVDLRLCKPDELHKSFRIQWQGSTGKEHALDFMSTGANSNTVHMIELAESQREALNEEIQARIADLYARAQCMDFYSSYDAVRRETNSEQNNAAGEQIA